MEIIETKVYQFNELSESAKEKAINNLYDLNVDFEWWESEFGYWQEKLAEIGFIDSKIAFSGFSSQGDGASFTSYVDIDTIVNSLIYCNCDYYYETKALLKMVKLESLIKIEIKRDDSRYSHEKTCYVYYGSYFDSEFCNSQLEELIEEIENLRYNLCKEIYDSLERQYYFLTSNEAITDTIEANDYWFLENGKLYF